MPSHISWTHGRIAARASAGQARNSRRVRTASAASSSSAFAGAAKIRSSPAAPVAPFAPGVSVPDKLESSIGTLNLNYGYPSAETVEKIYDNLDRSRALQAYLLAIPIVNQAGMRDSIRKFGPDNQTDVIWEDLVDPRTVEDRSLDPACRTLRSEDRPKRRVGEPGRFA